MTDQYEATLDSSPLCAASPQRGRTPRRNAPPVSRPGGRIAHSLVARSEQHQGIGDTGDRFTFKRLATCRKALVTGIGAIAAVAVSTKDPLGSFLPAGTTHWLAVGVALVTALATYLTTNTNPSASAATARAKPESAATTLPDDKPPATASTPQIGTALAGLALVVGGAVWASLRRDRVSRQVVPLALLIRPSDVAVSLTAHGNRR
jgi:hypothetical protein